MKASGGLRISAVILMTATVINSAFLSRAQTTTTAATVESLLLVPTEVAPQHGTFWSWQKQGNEPPLPFNPFPLLPLYALDTNTFTYDDSTVNYVTLGEDLKLHWTLKQLEQENGLETPAVPELGVYGESGGMQMMMESEGPPSPPGAGEGGVSAAGDDPAPPYNYPTNTLWLEITTVTNALAHLIVHGTVPDVAYEILSREALTNVPWASEGMILGAADQDWTPTTVPVGTRTNALFLWARSWFDTDGDGLPDWWELEIGLDASNPDTGDTGVTDGYKDADGDGWSNLQEYQNGTSPSAFDTPAAPTGLQVTMGSSGVTATIRWSPSSGPVTGYSIERSFTNQTIQVSSSVIQVTDADAALPAWLYAESEAPKFRLRAEYAGGASAWTEWQMPLECRAPTARGLSGHSGEVLLAVAGIGSAASVQAGIWNYNSSYYAVPVTSTNLPAANFASGIAAPPPPLATTATNQGFVRLISSSGLPSAAAFVAWSGQVPFWDGRQQLKQNLIFLLRAANVYNSFRFAYAYDQDPGYVTPSEYAFSGLYKGFDYDAGYPTATQDRLLPFSENYLYRNFMADISDVRSDGWVNTGLGYSTYLYADGSLKYQFTPPPSPGPIAPLLSPTGYTVWHEFWPVTYISGYGFNDDWETVGITRPATNFVMATGYRNLFGLPYEVMKLAWGSNTTQTAVLYPGGSVIGSGSAYNNGKFYSGVAQPEFELVDYYFGMRWDGGFNWNDQLPGHSGFSPTNPNPALIVPVGHWMRLAGYAKLAVTNGYAGAYGYLGQYFDRAYRMINGVATTNETGILSPYGEFFATEPGPTALVTMPDLDTNERGTAVVHVVKLQLDVNHDGEMDLSFAGPDNTSAARPFVFWVNNDYDRSHDTEEDDLASNDSDADSPDTGKPAPDCEYSRSGFRVIPSLRDLEDFARLWIGGVSTNLFAFLPAGVTADLSWGDIGNPNASNPTIEVFGTADAAGGIGYLTNFSAAWQQTNNSWYGTRLGPGDSIPVVYSNSCCWQYWNKAIWCGVKKGAGALTLTFRQGTNEIAKTSAYIEIKDVKEMYERWTVGDVSSTSPAPANQPYLAADGLPVGTPRFQYSPPGNTNTPYILLVHDYDLPTWKKDRYAETAFKRLYWQGYQGRFGFFRWPGVPDSFRPLDDSEFNAWRSGAGLLNLLTNLSAQYPSSFHLMAHGYGATAASEALRLAGANVVVDTYIAMQGAVASHAYDPSAPLRRPPPFATPDFYSIYHTNGASYFWPFGGAGAYINYFNTNDIVLTNDWRNTQETKPDWGYGFDGTNFYRGYPLMSHTPLFFPANTYEIFAYCDEARSEAIGAQLNLGGPFLNRQLDISTLYSPSGILSGNDHDAQFKSYCADTWSYWDAVLKSMGLKE